MTPTQLRALADDKDRAGAASLEAGDARAAAQAFHQANLLRATANEMDRLGRDRLPDVKALPPAVKARTIHDNVELSAEHKLAIAAAARPRGAKDVPSPLKKAAKEAGFTLAGLAAAVKKRGVPCSSSLLTMASDGTRPMPERTADVIAELIDFPKSRWRHLS